MQQGQALPPPCSKMAIPRPPVEVICSRYPRFMVKQRYQQGDEGGAGISVVPMRPSQPEQPCDDRLLPGELLLAGTAQAGSGFWGAVSGYLFLTGTDFDPIIYGHTTDIVRVDAPQPNLSPFISIMILDDPGNQISRVPGGFDLHFMADQTANCAVGGSDGAACLARLEQMTGAKISMAQCLKGEPGNDPANPVWVQYRAVLSVRGSHAALRATGSALRCISAA